MPPTETHPQAHKKPHLWQREMPLLVQQMLLYLSGADESVPELSKARYHQQTPSFREPFYLRQYGRPRLSDQITLGFSPADDLFTRRASMTMYINGLAEADIRTCLTENLALGGFSPGNTLENGFTAYCDGTSEIEVFIFAKDHATSISIRRR